MGFTTKLMIAYFVMLVLDGIAFAYGRREKVWLPFILVTAIMMLSIAIWGYLWVTSPM